MQNVDTQILVYIFFILFAIFVILMVYTGRKNPPKGK